MIVKLMSNHRKIWQKHYGPIPADEDGRSYEIHHIDGDRTNNDIENLQCVSIQEHYDIHYAQEDWGACFKISKRLQISPEEKSNLVSLSHKQRLKDGTHHSYRKSWRKKQSLKQKEKVKNGTHHFLGGKISSKISKKRVRDGTHPFLGKNRDANFRKKLSDAHKKNIENGSHCLLGANHYSAKTMTFINESGDILKFEPGKLTSMCRILGFSSSGFSQVWSGKRKTYRGWKKYNG